MNKTEIQNLVAKEVNDYLCGGTVASAYNAGDPTYGIIEGHFPFSEASDLETGRLQLGTSHYHISVFSPSDRKVYLLPPFATAPAAGATFEIFKYSKANDYDNIFTQVFGRLSGKILSDAEASMAIISTVVSYALPTNWKYVNSVELYKTDEVIPQYLSHRSWNPRLGKVFLRATLSAITYPTMVVLGQAHPTQPLNATVALEQDGIFQDCLTYRMAEHFAMRQFVKTTVKTFGSAYRSDSVEGNTARGATRSLSASIVGTTIGTTTRGATSSYLGTILGTTSVTITGTTTRVGTTGATINRLATITTKEHVTGIEEVTNEKTVQTGISNESEVARRTESTVRNDREQRAESSTGLENAAQSEAQLQKELETESSEDTSYQYTSGLDRNIAWEEEEDWLALANVARVNADVLEQYLFERVRPNSRRLR